jgi:hypothetical protein
LWARNLLNPVPHDVWCSAGIYPWYKNSTVLEDKECKTLQSFDENLLFRAALIAVVGLCIAITVVSMTLIIIYGLPKKNEDEDEDENGSSNSELDSIRRTIHYQSLVYIGTTLFLYGGCYIIAIFTNNPFIQFMRMMNRLAFQSLFHTFIFFYHKVHNFRQLDESITIKEALCIVIMNPKDVIEFRCLDVEFVSKYREGEDDSEVVIVEEGVDEASNDAINARSISDPSSMLDFPCTSQQPSSTLDFPCTK